MEYKPMNPITIAQLKQKRIWVCCITSPDSSGHVTKRPIAASGVATGTTRRFRKTWVTYDEAVAAVRERHFDGVGFVVPKGLAFVDQDGISPDDPFVETLMQLLPCYAERSVSGKGMHYYMLCEISRLPTMKDEQGKLSLDPRYYTKNPHNGLEVYIGGLTNRFALFTGNAVADLPLTDCTEGLQTVLDSYMLRDTQPAPAPAPAAEPEAEVDPEALDLMALGVISDIRRQKNAPKFSRLFDEGDTSGYKSDSEADLALASIVAYRAGSNPRLIEAVMRRSALCREKWNTHKTYLKMTIEKAISSCEEVFDPVTGEIPPFVVLSGRKHDTQTLSSPRLAEYFRQRHSYLLVRSRANQATQIYVYERGVYNMYDKNMMVGLLKEPVERFSIDLVNMGKIEEAYKHIMSDRDVIRYEDLNDDESVINFRNGLLRISADELTLVPHSPDVYSTIQLPCDWSEDDPPTPVFDQYMETFTGGAEGLQQLLLEVMGVILSNIKAWRMKKVLIIVGPGDTGKSQLKALTERLLGPGNYLSADLEEIEARFGTGNIFGTRLAGSSDMSFHTVDEFKTLKKIAGGDSLFAEFKGQQAFVFTYGGMLWFCTNQLPRFGGDDGPWVYERLMPVECYNVIPKEKQDKQLLDKMYAERDGIVRKAVMAAQQVIANGYRFSEPDCVMAARDAYLFENSTVVRFYEECMCPREPGDYRDGMTTGKVYSVYKSWCNDTSRGMAKTINEFHKELAAHLKVRHQDLIVHCEKGSIYRSLTVRPEVIADYHFVLGYDF